MSLTVRYMKSLSNLNCRCQGAQRFSERNYWRWSQRRQHCL